jgi:Rad3-related DNA helicase
MKGGCDYFDALKIAQHSRLVVTNYAYWMTANAYAEGLGRFSTLILDEAHDAPEQVSTFLTVTLSRSDSLTDEVLPDGDFTHYELVDWKRWANRHMPYVTGVIEMLMAHVERKIGGYESRRDLVRAMALKRSMEAIVIMDERNWVVGATRWEAKFTPKWPGPWCENVLFLGIPRVLLTSATISQKTAAILNVDAVIKEFPHTFPLNNRRLVHIPTVRMNNSTPDAGLAQWLTRIDQIIARRADRKGVIHTVSYKRRDLVVANSRYKKFMMTHSKRNTEKVVAAFKKADPPAILVSPSIMTGYDFPYDETEYMIVGKVPYPGKDAVTDARSEDDDEYTSFIAMQRLQQMAGRGVRAKDDHCEILVIDDNIGWFIKRYGKFAASWFREAYMTKAIIPDPPPKLERR